MSIIKKITGKIVNHNSSFIGNLTFDNKIKDIEKISSDHFDQIIIPGFVDLHCHGGNGFDVMEGGKSIENMANYHLKHGTTSIMPTTWTNTFEETHRALEGFDEKFYKNYKDMNEHIQRFNDHNINFLVFGRKVNNKFISLNEINIPEAIKDRCTGIEENAFRDDISSTEIRLTKT